MHSLIRNSQTFGSMAGMQDIPRLCEGMRVEIRKKITLSFPTGQMTLTVKNLNRVNGGESIYISREGHSFRGEPSLSRLTPTSIITFFSLYK